MDVEITTDDPVEPSEVAQALDDAGFYVHSVTVLSRANIVQARWTEID